MKVNVLLVQSRSSHPEVGAHRKGVLKICSKFTGEQPCRNVILIKLQSNFIEITLRHRYSPVNMLHISRTPFPMGTSGWLLLLTPKSVATFGFTTILSQLTVA